MGVHRRSRGRSGPRHGGAASRLCPRVTRGGARGAIGSPRVRRVARRKVRKEGRTAERRVRRAPRATPWSLAPRFGAADYSSRRLKRLRAAPAFSRDGRGRRPSRVTRLFASGSVRRRTLDTALRAGLTPHPTPTSRTPPEAPLWVGCTVYSPIGIKCQADNLPAVWRPLRNKFGAASRQLLALGPRSHSACAACARESGGWNWRSVSQQRFPGSL